MSSLRARVTLSVILPLILILGTFMVMQYRNQQDLMLKNMALFAAQTGLTIQNSLQRAMLDHNQEELQHILDSIGSNRTLRVVYLLDTSGKVIFAPESQGVGSRLDNRDPTCQPCHRLPPDQRPSSVVVTLADGKRVFRSMNPIVNEAECQSCHDPSQRLNGILLTDISMAPIEASLLRDLWDHIIWWVAAILVSALIANLVIDRFVLRRLEALNTAMKRLGLGQRSSPLPENQADEIGQVSLAFNEMVRQVETRNAENRQLSEDLHRQNTERGELLKRQISAQENERKRVARELHDELGQALAVLSLQTEAAHQYLFDRPDQAGKILDQTQALINDTSESMYNLILALRPSLLDDLGLVPALRSHAERILKDTSIVLTLDSSGLANRLPPELETVLYRVFQEAITNTVRHACASNLRISLSQADGYFVGTIADDGKGFDPEARHSTLDGPCGLGLLGMQERVVQYNGQLEIHSEVGRGTEIRIRVPLQEVSIG
jgi:signal transduction histidine kinase